jgi:hypothetical protein
MLPVPQCCGTGQCSCVEAGAWSAIDVQENKVSSEIPKWPAPVQVERGSDRHRNEHPTPVHMHLPQGRTRDHTPQTLHQKPPETSKRGLAPLPNLHAQVGVTSCAHCTAISWSICGWQTKGGLGHNGFAMGRRLLPVTIDGGTQDHGHFSENGRASDGQRNGNATVEQSLESVLKARAGA